MSNGSYTGDSFEATAGNGEKPRQPARLSPESTALTQVPKLLPYGIAEDPREEMWGILQPARRTGAVVYKAWRRRKWVAARAAAVHAFDQLRTQLLQAVRAEKLTRIAIVGPTSGSGATFSAVNLARSLARVPGAKTVLLDFNLRDPGIADTIGVEADGNIDEYLTGEVSMFEHLVRYDEGLALGLSETPRPHASDLLQSDTVADTLDEMEALLNPNLVLFDLPAVLEYDDLVAALTHIDGVLLVTDGNRTQAKDIEACERLITSRGKLMGVVLNRANG